jgi:hypothetical protein
MRHRGQATNGADQIGFELRIYKWREKTPEGIKMKLLFLRVALFIALAVVAASFVTTANAQTSAFQANVPFAFQVANKTLAAGAYTVDVERVYRRVDLRSAEGRTIFVASNPSGRSADKKSMLVFHRYGDRYFLYEVVSQNAQFAHRLPVSKAERTLTNVAGVQPVVETVVAGSR